MKKKQALLALALIGCLLMTSACTLHMDRDPWPSNDQTAATPDPAVTPLPTVDPNADPGMNG